MKLSAAEGAIATIASAQHGAVTWDQASAAGVSHDQVRRLRQRGWLVQVARGLYRLRDHPRTWEQRLALALLAAGDGAVASRRSAARLHGLWRYRTSKLVEVTRREPGDHEISTGTLHRSSWLPASHVTEVDGFPCTTVARTLFDLAGDPDPALRRSPAGAELHRKDIARVFNDALRRHGLTLAHQVAVFVALAKRGRSGTVLMRELLQDFRQDLAPTESDGESLFLELVRATGREEPKRQVVVVGRQGFIAKVDFLYEQQRLNVEIDGLTHRGPLDVARDRLRDEQLRAEGYDVLRIDYGDLLTDPQRALRRLDRALARRSA